jgi:hypothetical protein
MDDEAELEGQLIDLEAQIAHLNKVMAEANVPALPDDTPSVEDFDQTVAEIRKRDNCSRTEALAKGRSENQAGFAAYCAGYSSTDFTSLVEEEIRKGCSPAVALQRVAAHHPEFAKAAQTAPKSVADFMAAVDAVMAEQELSRTEAMTAVRKAAPELYANFQEV